MRCGTASEARGRWRRLRLAALTLAWLASGGAGRARAQDECLLRVKAARVTVTDNQTVCQEAQNKTCVFQLQACLNQRDGTCAAAPMKRKVKAKGSCRALAKLQVKPDGTNPVCGAVVGVKVKTKRRGRREGSCRITIAARSSDKPARRDVEKLTLVCKPDPGDCPARVAVGSTTTTTLPCFAPCDCCVRPVTDLFGCVGR